MGGSGLEVGRAVGHGHTGAHGPEHLQIVVAVAKGHGVGFRDAIGLQHDGDAVALASGSGDDVHGAVPPGGDLGSAHILQDAAVLVLPAAHHDLVHGAGGNGVKVGRYRNGDLGHGKIIVQILLVAVGGKGALGGHAQGAAQGGGVPAQRAHVLCRDGAGKQHPVLIVAVGTVEGDQYVKLHTGEIPQWDRHGGATGGDGQPDAVCLQTMQGVQHERRHLLFLHVDESAVNVEEDDPGFAHRKAPFRLVWGRQAGRCLPAPVQ